MQNKHPQEISLKRLIITLSLILLVLWGTIDAFRWYEREYGPKLSEERAQKIMEEITALAQNGKEADAENILRTLLSQEIPAQTAIKGALFLSRLTKKKQPQFVMERYSTR